MDAILVEEDFVHIDGTDMNAILELLGRLGLDAEPTAPRGGGRGRQWELTMHWQTHGPISEATENGLRDTAGRIREHFVAAGKRAPSKVVLCGRDGLVLRTFQ
ncbi:MULTISPECIES: hypothetical protein [unclassified Kitasatospora]|uniref:hypothetical protein n=1 Tax=unclassified Kitasatospora TaxID=2633591 RepID=UPI00365AE13E